MFDRQNERYAYMQSGIDRLLTEDGLHWLYSWDTLAELFTADPAEPEGASCPWPREVPLSPVERGETFVVPYFGILGDLPTDNQAAPQQSWQVPRFTGIGKLERRSYTRTAVDDEYDMEFLAALDELPKGLAEQVREMLDRLHERVASANYTDTRAPLYVTRCNQLATTFLALIPQWVNGKRRQEKGHKNAPHDVKLDSIWLRIKEALAIDLESPTYCPINPEEFASSSLLQLSNGNRATHIHQRYGLCVCLVWTKYNPTEPAYWIAFKDIKSQGGYCGIENTPENAASDLKQKLEQIRSEAQTIKIHIYTRGELRSMLQLKDGKSRIRTIARGKGVEVSGLKFSRMIEDILAIQAFEQRRSGVA